MKLTVKTSKKLDNNFHHDIQYTKSLELKAYISLQSKALLHSIMKNDIWFLNTIEWLYMFTQN